MELLDYTGKLNTHEEYLKVLDKLEDRCKYIEIVVLDGRESNKIVDSFKNSIILRKKVTSWLGTGLCVKEGKIYDYSNEYKFHERVVSNWLYQIKSSKELFRFLRNYETFCKYYFAKKYSKDFGNYVDIQEKTDFGIDDIAFFDEREIPLLCTTTHECFIMIREDLEKEIRC